MKMIKRQLWLSCFTAGAAIILLLVFLVLKEYLLAGIAAGAAGIGIVFVLRGIQKQKSTKLILENRLIDTCPATVSTTDGSGMPVRRVIECVFSPFGLLLEGKVYKFGRDGVRLHSIDIGNGRIMAEFGNDEKCWAAVLLHTPLSKDEMARLMEKVEYETGIIPTLLDSSNPHQGKETP